MIAADIHIRELMRVEKLAIHSNHGLFQMAGLLSLGRLLPFLSSSEGLLSLHAKDSLHVRGSFHQRRFAQRTFPIYHVYMTNFVYSLVRSGFLDGRRLLRRWLKMP